MYVDKCDYKATHANCTISVRSKLLLCAVRSFSESSTTTFLNIPAELVAILPHVGPRRYRSRRGNGVDRAREPLEHLRQNADERTCFSDQVLGGSIWYAHDLLCHILGRKTHPRLLQLSFHGSNSILSFAYTSLVVISRLLQSQKRVHAASTHECRCVA